ncbi:hypothetical protein [uncultured Helicobacter sp.]|nr:hypothetical protein [uncultured Helicobacter sp.]
MPMQDKPLAQKLDEQVFEKFLKYNPQTQNLWDIVGFFEYERQKLRLEVAQYHEEIKISKTKLKELRECITLAQNTLHNLEQKQSQMPQPLEADNQLQNALRAEIAELELENSKLRVELRDLRSEFQLEENLAHIGENHSINNMDSKKPKGR